MKTLYLIQRYRTHKKRDSYVETEIISTYDTERGIQVQKVERRTTFESGKIYWDVVWRGRASTYKKWEGDFGYLRGVYLHFGVSKYYDNSSPFGNRRVTKS